MGLLHYLQGCRCRLTLSSYVTDSWHIQGLKPAHTVAEKCDCRRCLAVFGDSRTFLRQCGQGFTGLLNMSIESVVMEAPRVASPKRLKPYPHCRRKVRLSQKTARVDSRRIRRLSPLYCRTFLRQCGQALSNESMKSGEWCLGEAVSAEHFGKVLVARTLRIAPIFTILV